MAFGAFSMSSFRSQNTRNDAEKSNQSQYGLKAERELQAILQNPGSKRDELKKKINESPEFRNYIGIRNPNRLAKCIGLSEEVFQIGRRVIAPAILAEVATLSITDARAKRALDRLEDLLLKDIPNTRLGQEFMEAASEGFICLLNHIPDMADTLAQRVAEVIKGCTSFISENEQRGIYQACAYLEKNLHGLKEFGEARLESIRRQAAKAGHNERVKILKNYNKYDGVPTENVRMIINEAIKRGITVHVKSPMRYTLSRAGKTYDCCGSITPLISPEASELCGDKTKTSKFFASVGISAPEQHVHDPDKPEASVEFMRNCGSVVVKPSKGTNNGDGVSVDIRNEEHLNQAIAYAQKTIKMNEPDARILIEQFCKGTDLRILVINYKVVAVGERQAAQVVGDGGSTIEELIKKTTETGGKSRIPIDEETERCLKMQNLNYKSKPGAGDIVQVRNNANTSTGGKMIDVTDEIPQELLDVFENAARKKKLAVVGFDCLMETPKKYVGIEANTGPVLTGHDPQPVAARFIDMLYPNTINRS